MWLDSNHHKAALLFFTNLTYLKSRPMGCCTKQTIRIVETLFRNAVASQATSTSRFNEASCSMASTIAQSMAELKPVDEVSVTPIKPVINYDIAGQVRRAIRWCHQRCVLGTSYTDVTGVDEHTSVTMRLAASVSLLALVARTLMVRVTC
jgi:hypothetical protein